MRLADYLRIQAHANALANRRLGEAMAALPQADWRAPRTGFFPSLAATLDHVLAVDGYYLGALLRQVGLVEAYRAFRPSAQLRDWRERQQPSDLRLIAFCDGLDERSLDAPVELPRGDHVQRDRVGHVLAHLFNHQTHHRGQAHAMLSGTGVAPPQLDEFMMPSEAHLREADLRAFGWDEAAIYAAPADAR